MAELSEPVELQWFDMLAVNVHVSDRSRGLL